jgi:ubiquinone/menaquinone biosynthesis C-methylase UbiE
MEVRPKEELIRDELFSKRAAEQLIGIDPRADSCHHSMWPCASGNSIRALGCCAMCSGMAGTMKNAYSDIGTASRYDSARNLPSKTMTLWLDALKSSIPRQEIGKILDLGCGTGRFTVSLGKAFACSVIGVEPASAMLNVALSQNGSNVEWKQGAAENIPLENEAVDLVFMSQVFHHLTAPQTALREINRVLAAAGYLAIRNSIREHNKELDWLRFFPEAIEIEEKRMPSRQELKESVSKQSFKLISQRTIYQLFADSYEEYFEKISRRGLSALIAISDEAFQLGLQKFQGWVIDQPRNLQIYEPVDLFVFQKKSL